MHARVLRHVVSLSSATMSTLEETDHGVSSLELFTDLVFVFAITQLTALLTDDPTASGVLEVLLILAILVALITLDARRRDRP
jgi:low temperature requirement protein LtrA